MILLVLLSGLEASLDQLFEIERLGKDPGFHRFIPQVFDAVNFDWRSFFEERFCRGDFASTRKIVVISENDPDKKAATAFLFYDRPALFNFIYPFKISPHSTRINSLRNLIFSR